MIGDSKLPPVASKVSWRDGGSDWARGVGAWMVDLSADTGVWLTGDGVGDG